MGNLEDLLKKHAKRLGIDRQVEAVGVVEEATKIIAKYISREDFEVISFKDHKLKIYVSSPVVANQMSLYSSQIIKDMSLVNIKISKIKTTLQNNIEN